MIKEEIIQRADEFLQNTSDAALNKYMNEVSSAQGDMVSYVLAMGEILDDEEYFNKYIYFYLLVHRAYTNRFRFFPKLNSEIIRQIEDNNQQFFTELLDKEPEVFEKEMEDYIRKHPQKLLIDFITLDLFESEESSYDDIGLQMDNQIFFLLLTIINIYEQSLVESQKDMDKDK